MSSIAARTGHYTFDDFLLLVQEHEKADLLDGAIYIASPESIDDNKLGGWLYRLMSEFAEATGRGDATTHESPSASRRNAARNRM